MKYCKKCLYPDTKPMLKFNDEGICDACTNWDKKSSIDWESRKNELKKIADNYYQKNEFYSSSMDIMASFVKGQKLVEYMDLNHFSK